MHLYFPGYPLQLSNYSYFLSEKKKLNEKLNRWKKFLSKTSLNGTKGRSVEWSADHLGCMSQPWAMHDIMHSETSISDLVELNQLWIVITLSR